MNMDNLKKAETAIKKLNDIQRKLKVLNEMDSPDRISIKHVGRRAFPLIVEIENDNDLSALVHCLIKTKLTNKEKELIEQIKTF